jgi:outer membrane murein-binding lipoprotein Lpp
MRCAQRVPQRTQESLGTNGKVETQARKIQEQETAIRQLKKEVETVIAQLQAAGRANPKSE